MPRRAIDASPTTASVMHSSALSSLIGSHLPLPLPLQLTVAVPTLPLAMNPSRLCQIRSNILRDTFEDCVPFVLMFHPACCPCLRDRLRLALITVQLAEVLQDPTHHPFAQKPPSPPRSLPRRGADSPRFTIHCAACPASRPTSRARPMQRATPLLQHRACHIADESTIQPPAMSSEHQAHHRTLLARSRSALVPAGTPRGIDLLAHLDQDRLNREYLVLGRPERLLQQQRLATTAAADGGLEDLEPTAFGAELARSL
ncbi:hypothetical protein BKA62DRAFT_776654 [Auriculariales sp. MPI-PUGE-AT-0066]|nr:hypothetical protein BKA62DRAFT_776654 [Auriculariales sp. MPI-PUGE-AT-0066]